MLNKSKNNIKVKNIGRDRNKNRNKDRNRNRDKKKKKNKDKDKISEKWMKILKSPRRGKIKKLKYKKN